MISFSLKLPIRWNIACRRRYMYSVFRSCTEYQFLESKPCLPLPVCGHFTMAASQRKEEELHGFTVFTQVKVKTSLYVLQVDSSWNVVAHGDAREGIWRGNWRMEWVASTLHTTSKHGLSSITTADAHTSAANSRLNWRPRRFKWSSPFRRKTKSGFCERAVTF